MGEAMNLAERSVGLSEVLLQVVENESQTQQLQRLLDRYAHRVRNRLNSLKLSLYLARRLANGSTHVDWTKAEAAYRSLEGLLEQLQQVCGSIEVQPMTGSLTDWIRERQAIWQRQLDQRSIRLDYRPGPTRLIGQYDAWRLGQGFDALVGAWSQSGPIGSDLQLTAAQEGNQFVVYWASDHPGPWFQPNPEGTESLALPLLVRVIKAHGGAIDIQTVDRLFLTLRWPTKLLASENNGG